jgi:hypothetical protein
VVEVPAGCNDKSCQTTVGSNLSAPSGVVVDAAGDVFISDQGLSQAVEVPVGCSSAACQTTVGSGLSYPIGIAVDGAGDVFIADLSNNDVVEVQRSQPPSFSFASTPVGSTSSDSPQSVVIQNVGNQPLDAVAPGLVVTGPNFVQTGGSGTPTDCTGKFALTPGSSCNLSVSFEPQGVGPRTSTATFTDNTLNTSPSAKQNIALQGTGSQGTVSVTVGTNPAGLAFSVDGTNYNSAQTVSWTIGSQHTIATISPQTPVAGTQYNFANWSDGTFSTSDSVTASASTTSYTAYFNTAYLLTTAVNPANGGTVSPPSGTYYGAGKSVALSATANAGYTFSNWTGNVDKPGSAATTITMSAPESVTANFTASTNPTTTTLISSLNPSTYGQSVTFTASVASTGGGTPTGSVTFSDGKNALGTISLSKGTAALSTSLLGGGSHSITASYSGDNSNQSSASTVLTQTVQTASTTLGLTSNLNPSVYNQAVTFTATVTPQAGGSATGTVTLYDFATKITLGAASVSGNQATIVLTGLPVGTGYIASSYSGDSNFTGSISNEVFQVVKKAVTAMEVSSSPNPAFVRQTVTFTALVSSQYQGAVSGTVTFASGGVSLGSATLANGQASVTTAFSAPGNHAITAKYLGDSNNKNSASSGPKEVVTKYPSSTTVVSNLNPSVVGQQVTFTATVSTSGSPTGTVTFKSGATTLGTVGLTGNSASLSTSALPAGTHIIKAVYSGDATFAASTSPGLSQVVTRH